MSLENIIAPIGMKSVEEFLIELNERTQINTYCGINPPHFLVYLDSGNGQTTLTEYITDYFLDRGIRKFGSIDTYLEYELDGSMNQLKEIYTDLNSWQAMYMDKYNGVVAINLGALATKYNEPQIPFFINMVNELKESATFVFYSPTVRNSTLNSLIEDLKKKFDDMVIIDFPSYTTSEFAEIVVRDLGNMGISIEGDNALDIIKKRIEEQEITTAKGAVKWGKNLIEFARFRDSEVVLELNNDEGIEMSKRRELCGGK